MQKSRENERLVHWDRLQCLTRQNSAGEIVEKGDALNNVVRIFQGENRRWIQVSCIMQTLLECNIYSHPCHVSNEDGLKVQAWMTEVSGNGGNPIKRLYEFTFVNDSAAQMFFESFVEGLPPGLSYYEMRTGEREAILSCSTSEDEEEEEKNWKKNDSVDDEDEDDDDGKNEQNNIEEEAEGAKQLELLQ